MAAITLDGAGRWRGTLETTNRRVVTHADGSPAQPTAVIITWDASDQSASNLVYVEVGADAVTDNVAIGTGSVVIEDVHPGSGYSVVRYVGGRPVALSGSSAFDVSVQIVP